jgi:uncharacterized protein (DUF1330 family)
MIEAPKHRKTIHIEFPDYRLVWALGFTRLIVVEFEHMEQARATFASPSYDDVRTIGNKYAKFRIVAVEGPSQ